MHEAAKIDTSTTLAAARTQLAVDRTLMAWIRTAFSMISFGFSIVKFFQYLRKDVLAGATDGHGPRNLGIALVTMGIVSLAIGLWEHRCSSIKLAKLQGNSRNVSWVQLVALSVLAMGLLTLVGIALRVGPFE
jgi:putative membrane protein